MSAKITVLLTILAILSISLPSAGAPWGGAGTEGDPYRIYTAEDLNSVGADSNYRDAHFKLMADIDLSAYTGDSFNIIGTRRYDSFIGVFDGNDHTISNFSYTSPAGGSIGLFGYVGDILMCLVVRSRIWG